MWYNCLHGMYAYTCNQVLAAALWLVAEGESRGADWVTACSVWFGECSAACSPTDPTSLGSSRGDNTAISKWFSSLASIGVTVAPVSFVGSSPDRNDSRREAGGTGVLLPLPFLTKPSSATNTRWSVLRSSHLEIFKIRSMEPRQIGHCCCLSWHERTLPHL